MIPYGRQSIDRSDIESVTAILEGDWLTQGPTIERFEKELAERVGAQHAVAFSSCTAALHGSAWSVGLGPGDVAYTSPLTFMATANAVRYVGAQPGLVDINPDTYNINLSAVPTDAEAVIPVHYAGLPVDLNKANWSFRPPKIIEDAAHALGARTERGPVGNCADSDLTCFSFHPVKPITTGEGGMVTTNSEELAERLRVFRSHGIVRKPERGEWYYEIESLGYHYRMTDIQAALGLSQLRRLDEFIAKRNEIAERYRSQLRGVGDLILPPEAPEGSIHGYHLFAIHTKRRDELFAYLRQQEIGVQVHYVPVHHHPISEDLRPDNREFPVTDSVYSGLMSIPIHPGLTDEEVGYVVETIKSFYEV